MSNNQELADILSMLLGQDIDINSDVSMTNCEVWDSMKHIEIITTLEEEFNISFPIEDIPKLTSYALLLDAINKLT